MAENPPDPCLGFFFLLDWPELFAYGAVAALVAACLIWRRRYPHLAEQFQYRPRSLWIAGAVLVVGLGVAAISLFYVFMLLIGGLPNRFVITAAVVFFVGLVPAIAAGAYLILAATK